MVSENWEINQAIAVLLVKLRAVQTERSICIGGGGKNEVLKVSAILGFSDMDERVSIMLKFLP